MGLLKKITRAITRPVIKLIDHVVPGGKYLTGSEQARQNRLYNAAVNEHNAYGEQAQRTINDFSNRLNEEWGDLGV